MSKEKPSTIKYIYKGTTLRKYCKEHNLNYDTVVKRIKNKKMSIEQAVTTPKMNKSYLLCSDGVPLINKCNTISEYRACLWRIKNYNKTVDESLTPINKGRARAILFYNGKTFREWCETYQQYRRAIQRYRSGHSKKVSLFGNKWDLIYG